MRAALTGHAGDARLPAIRRAYLSPRFEGILLAHLERALATEGIRCVDCPPPFVPAPVTHDWATLLPYLSAYVWADPVTTPRDGEAKYTMHICVGTNGIAELAAPDGALVELGVLATFHSDVVRTRAPALYREIRRDPAFARLANDDARTRWLRAELGPRLFAEPEVRSSVCANVERFAKDTGIAIAECEHGTVPVRPDANP